MRLSTVHATPEGVTLYCKGALQSVLPLCSRILVDGEARLIERGLPEQIIAAEESMAEQGCASSFAEGKPLWRDEAAKTLLGHRALRELVRIHLVREMANARSDLHCKCRCCGQSAQGFR